MNLGRKVTGGKYHALRKRRLHQNRSKEGLAVLGETKRKVVVTRGGNAKAILFRTDSANILTKPGKIEKAKIVNIVETPQNRFFARQNRLMKGAIIETSLGKARISNRPSQDGQVNAILIK